ncbi:MAG: DUF1232 domain-containing protein [Anaerolineae bacterium]|nr:DUF1232 domain-containing protein [Anaerolineae bacterium]
MFRFEAWKEHARALKTEVYALYLAYRDPRVPWYARLLAACVVAYAFSPIDLIPDPIPVLGYLDDLMLIPLGIWLVLKMIPADVMVDCRAQAKKSRLVVGQSNWIAGAVVIGIWLGLALLAVLVVARLFAD